MWGASRAFFLTVGALAAHFVSPARPGVVPEPAGILNYWAHWDGAWYSHIATEGYDSPASTAFFPLYPLLLRAGTMLGGGPAVWGVVISSAALLFALFFIYRLAEDRWDERVARATTAAIAFFPSAFFLNAVYTEALFLALASGTLWAAYVRRDLLIAGFFAYFAATTRNVGVLLALPLAYDWLRHRARYGWTGVTGIVAAPAGLAAYLIYVKGVTGHPLTFAVEQERTWGRATRAPWTTLSWAWDRGRDGWTYLMHPERVFATEGINESFALANAFNLIFLALVAVLLVVALVRLPPALAIFTLLLIVAPILTPTDYLPLTGLPRYLLAAFPLFFVLGLALARSTTALVAWIALCLPAGAFLTVLFTSWRWGG